MRSDDDRPCEVCGKPMYTAEVSGERACSDPECAWATALKQPGWYRRIGDIFARTVRERNEALKLVG